MSQGDQNSDELKALQEELETLREENIQLRAALEAKPGAEARGVAFVDLYKTLTQVTERDPKTNKPTKTRSRLTKMCITARSDVGPKHAYALLRLAVAEASKDGWHPYNPM